MQFALATYGGLSKEDTSSMTPFELENSFELLKRKIELEAERNSE